MTPGDITDAGASSYVEVVRSQLRIEQYKRLLADEIARMGRWDAARRSEQRVAAQLHAMRVWGWKLLADRRWPGTRKANVDLILVGPGGVLIIDVKAWRSPRMSSDGLFNGDTDQADELRKVEDVTLLADDAVGGLGLAPVRVVPVIVLAGHAQRPASIGRTHLLGEPHLVPWVASLPPRLSEEQVSALTEILAERFPPYQEDIPTQVSVVVPEPVLPRTAGSPPDELALFDVAELEDSLLESAMAGPIESWMTWLHPEQARLVRQARNGPSRLRGPAGTGKTVIGLHRAAYLAETRPGQILFTSFVRTLPPVQRSLYERLSPRTVTRVEFVNLHRWAFHLLVARRQDFRCDEEAARAVFNRAWVTHGRHGLLGELKAHPNYWWDEISCVIKGRGQSEFDSYRSLRRVGRRTPLKPDQREAVWDLFLAYEAGLRRAGISDLNDVLRLTLESLRQEPLQPGYTAVIVDEVQDLNQIGIQILHSLVGDAPDGLLLIGDGQQSVYPGGFSLFDAGVSIPGARSTVLSTNYRNGAQILDLATTVVANDEYEDLDGTALSGARSVTAARQGGLIVRVDEPNSVRHEAALLAAIRQSIALGARPGDMAVLCDDSWVANRKYRVLAAEGFDVMDLAHYDGSTSSHIKVGTFRRAKGLEFSHVYLPRLSSRPLQRLQMEDAATYQERVELAHRRLFVGMTRARDFLWLGYLD